MRITVLLVLMLSVLASGCKILGLDDSPPNELELNQTRWSSYHDGDYHFEVQRGCFCVNGGSFWVQVVDSKIVFAINNFSQEQLPDEHLEYFETIDEIFEMLRNAEKGADELEVQYSTFGYPSMVTIDWNVLTIDDEMSLTVSNLILGVALID